VSLPKIAVQTCWEKHRSNKIDRSMIKKKRVNLLLQILCALYIFDTQLSAIYSSRWLCANTLASDANGWGSTPGGSLTDPRKDAIGKQLVIADVNYQVLLCPCGYKTCGWQVTLMCDPNKHGPCRGALCSLIKGAKKALYIYMNTFRDRRTDR